MTFKKIGKTATYRKAEPFEQFSLGKPVRLDDAVAWCNDNVGRYDFCHNHCQHFTERLGRYLRQFK
jgi:hypothetical protein